MAPEGRKRILIVDDSAVMRSLLRTVIARDAALEVAGTAADGASALGLMDVLRPDVVLLDVEMPVMDGLSTLKGMRERGHHMPVVMCSALTQRGARVTIEALATGAADYVTKPGSQDSRDAAVETLARELLPKLRALTGGGTALPGAMQTRRGDSDVPMVMRTPTPVARPAVVVIGVSTGGPAALEVLLPALPESFPLPVLVVQHMPELFTQTLAERLDGRCRLRVQEARDRDRVRAGTVHLARGNWHLEMRAGLRPGEPVFLHLTQAPMENHCRPAVDVLLRSAVGVFGGGVLAVQLTGMGSDGLAGCRAVRAQGGTVLAQDKMTSAVWGMPGAVAHAGLAHRVLPIQAMASEILRLTMQLGNEARGLQETAVRG